MPVAGVWLYLGSTEAVAGFDGQRLEAAFGWHCNPSQISDTGQRGTILAIVAEYKSCYKSSDILRWDVRTAPDHGHILAFTCSFLYRS
jgi:hypothetical protein